MQGLNLIQIPYKVSKYWAKCTNPQIFNVSKELGSSGWSPSCSSILEEPYCELQLCELGINIKVIFLLGSHISKSTQGASSSVLLKPVPVGGSISCWAHLCHFHKYIESKRRSQRRTMELTQERFPIVRLLFILPTQHKAATEQNHLNIVKVPHAWRVTVRGQTRDSVLRGQLWGESGWEEYPYSQSCPSETCH